MKLFQSLQGLLKLNLMIIVQIPFIINYQLNTSLEFILLRFSCHCLVLTSKHYRASV